MRKVSQVIYNIVIGIRNIGLAIVAAFLVLYLPIVGRVAFDYYAYQYVIIGRYNSISDKSVGINLMTEGQSFYKDSDYIYAYKEGVFLILENKLFFKSDMIIAYVDKINTESKALIYKNEHYYNGKIKIIYDESLLSLKELEVYNILKDRKNNFESQGI
ncbi:hypothetical protein [Veillonella agrestimuris]|uniref:hypothetical protein n=1 Tax=Veillonella agrestimuris TaxID=2941340 RepID=UPI00203F7FF3|nr:hypothetical protein [Veillonella agrestimuris]